MSEYEFSKKWSLRVSVDGYTQIPNLLITEAGVLGLKPNEFMLLACLIKHAWTADAPFPSHATLCKYMGIKETQLKRIIIQLEVKGFLKRISGGQRATNRYDLKPLLARLEEASKTNEIKEEKIIERIKRKRARQLTNTDP